MIVTFETGDGDDAQVHALEIDDELLEMARDKPDFIACEVRGFLSKALDG